MTETHMDVPTAGYAWAWFNLGQARQWLGSPQKEVFAAYEKARALAPGEHRFKKPRRR